VPVSSGGGTLTLASVCGFSGALNYPSNNAPSGTSETLITQVPSPGSFPLAIPAGATYLMNVELALVSTAPTITFNPGFLALTINVPASIPTSGHHFYALACGPVTAGCSGSPVGPFALGVSGQKLTFSGIPAAFVAPISVYFEAQTYYTTP